MSVRSTIISQFEQVAKEQDKHLPALSDDLARLGSRLSVLCHCRGAPKRFVGI